MKSTFFIWCFSCLILFSGCSHENVLEVQDSGQLELDYFQKYVYAVYNLPGSMFPEIDWHGDKGEVSLLSADPVFSVDPSTGELKWERLKELNKEYTVLIHAKNSKAEIKKELKIKCVFQGEFTLKWTTDVNSESYESPGIEYNVYPEGDAFYFVEENWWNSEYTLSEDGKLNIEAIVKNDKGEWIGCLIKMELAESSDSIDKLIFKGYYYEYSNDSNGNLIISDNPVGKSQFVYEGPLVLID